MSTAERELDLDSAETGVPAQHTLAQRLISEFIGTFFLVFTIVTAVSASTKASPNVLAPLAIGSVLMVMIFAGGHISGAHFNPAVSLAIFIRGRMTAAEMVAYWVVQLVGAAVAALVGLVLFPHHAVPAAFSGSLIGHALLVEFLFTFALAYVVLNVATSSANLNNFFYGLAIGFTVLAGAVSVGGISGGAFNPAVALGVSIAGLSNWGSLWVLVIADLLGGAAAAVVFKLLNPRDK